VCARARRCRCTCARARANAVVLLPLRISHSAPKAPVEKREKSLAGGSNRARFPNSDEAKFWRRRCCASMLRVNVARKLAASLHVPLDPAKRAIATPGRSYDR
jgi:hypothetical protein